MDVKEHVLNYFQTRGQTPLPGATETERLGCRYLDLGIVDSMGIVEMIAEFEEKFGIHFESDHLQSNEFQTVGGLIHLIGRLMNHSS